MTRGALVFVLAAACYQPAHQRFTAPLPEAAAPATAVTPPVDWTFDVTAAVAYALAHGGVVEERRDLERIAEARIGAARQLANPEVRIGYSSDELATRADHDLTVALRFHPEMPWALDAKIAAARAERTAERAVTASATRVLAAEIRRRYIQLAFGDATRLVLVHELELLTRRKQVLDDQLQRAATTKLEVVLAEQDLADLDAARAGIELAMAQQRGELAGLIGIPPRQEWRPQWDAVALVAVRTGLDARALADRALANRPELAEAAARADAAGARAYAERTRRVPWIDTLQLERSFGDPAEWGATVTLALPVFSLSSGKIAEAEAQRRRYAAAGRREAGETVRRVEMAVALVEATGTRVRSLRTRLEPTSRAISELLAQSAAAVDPVKLLLLEERHVRSQRALLEAAYDHRIALVGLEALVGAPL